MSIFKISSVLLLFISVAHFSFGQTIPVKVDTTKKSLVKSGNITKDLNALERENIESLNLKQQAPSNYVPKKIDTTNLDMFSTSPIVKGAPKKKATEKTPVATPVITKPVPVVKPIDSTSVVKKAEPKPKIKTDSAKAIVKPADAVKKQEKVVSVPSASDTLKKVVKVKEDIRKQVPDSIKVPVKVNKDLEKEVKGTKAVPRAEEKKVIPVLASPVKSSTEDFSTQSVVKSKKSVIAEEVPASTEQVAVKKFSIDTTKNFKEFTFETTPVVNKNASYNRRNEPLPKTKEQVDEDIPVNRKPLIANSDKDNSFAKETYAQYNKEADSIRMANKRVLDSVMRSLKIKVPVIVSPSDYIDIYVSGGGVIQNESSKLYDHISILHTGVVQREYKSKLEGVQRTEKKISKDELTKLAQYILDLDFMDMQRMYDCSDADAVCNERLTKSPQPVPLEVTITVADKKNKVSVAFYVPKSERNWVGYPANLEKIMNAILAIAEK